eukprot:TRINITY_DN73188_c0_g1_i1.p1 TRINITY_DN73188_c0_g1~~TRINITY_DN73188_c0_g1_i1.p1  ORF type:complete len:813 (+),score=132.77 TRINITY_DN73188_c0_g1_i1:142-2580(+)
MSFDSSCFTSDEALCVLESTNEVPDRLALTDELSKIMRDTGSDVPDELKELQVHTSDSMAGFSPLASKSFKSSHSTKSQPSNEEVAKYLERHNIQAFFSFATTILSSERPPDPFNFLLQQISQIVAKFQERERGNTFLLGLDRPNSVPEAERLPTDMSQDQQEKIILHLMTVLQSSNLTVESANVLFNQFSGGSKKLSKDKFKTLLQHLRMKWGLCCEDTVLMMETLKRWRFRTNASSGTLGLPLWPLRFEDFVKCYPTLLRVVYNRYTPFSGHVDRALFIRQAAGTLDEKYEMGRKLGRGAYGEVVLVKHRMTREHRVCKKVRHRQQRISDAELPEEVELLRRLDHPHIIRIFEYFDTEEFLFMIMEPVFGGTLAKLISELYPVAHSSDDIGRPEHLRETWVATFMAQLLGALAYAHGAVGLVHKDLKSENILLVGKPDLCPEEVLKQPIHAMLADFGIAEVFEPDVAAPSPTFARGNISSSKVGGTPAYMSPEMFKGTFTEKCDIWSMGVVMFHLMTGTLPYRPRNLLAHAHSVCDPHKHPEWELLTKNKWTLGARLFCQLLLSKEEGMRPSAAEACKDNWLVRTTEFADEEPSPDERMALQHQHLQSHIMRMARLCITSQLNLSPLHHLNHRFRQYDSDGNGRLNHLEMRQVLEDVGISSSEDIDLIIESLDSNDNGLIDYSEFIAGCLDLASDGMKAKLRAVFDIFDLDGSGTISVDELRQVLTHGGANSTRVQQSTCGLLDVLPDGKTVEDVMRDVDADGTGQIEFAEFERYLLAEHEAQGAKLAVKSLSDMCLRNMSLQHERVGDI